MGLESIKGSGLCQQSSCGGGEAGLATGGDEMWNLEAAELF